jgi:hypothetical protein
MSPGGAWIPDGSQVQIGAFLSVRGVQKHHTNIFAESPCRKLFPTKSTKTSMPVFFDFFCLSRFRVFLSGGSSKTLQKTFYQKIVSNCFYKKIDQKSKTEIFSNFFITFLVVSR